MIRLGYNTNGFGSHRLEDAIEVIGGLGFRSVAITLDHGALHPQDPQLEAQLDRVRAQLGRAALLPVVEAGARFALDPWRKHRPTLLEADGSERRRRIDFLLGAVRVAAAIGAPVVSLWSGCLPDDVEPEAAWDWMLEGLREVCDAAAACEVRVGFEPEPGMLVEDMAGYDALREALAHPALGLTLDLCHVLLTEPDVVETVRQYLPQIVNIHVDDGRRTLGHAHLVPGTGDIDIPGVMHALQAGDYAGPANVELSRHSHDAVRVARGVARYFAELSLP